MFYVKYIGFVNFLIYFRILCSVVLKEDQKDVHMINSKILPCAIFNYYFLAGIINI